MGLGNFLHKIGRGAAAARLSMHGYTPELLEKERALLRELYEEKQAERERKARADARAEEAEKRADLRAEEERKRQDETRFAATAKAMADEVSPFARTFLESMTPEEADARGLKPEQVYPALDLARRIYQTKQDEDRAKRDREKQEKIDAASEAEKTWLRHLNATDEKIRGRRRTLTPKQQADPDIQLAKEILRQTEDPDAPFIDPDGYYDKLVTLADSIKKKKAEKAAGGALPDPGPPPALGYSLRKPTTIPRSITSPGQPVGRSIDLGGGLTVRVRPR